MINAVNIWWLNFTSLPQDPDQRKEILNIVLEKEKVTECINLKTSDHGEILLKQHLCDPCLYQRSFHKTLIKKRFRKYRRITCR